MDFRFKVSGDDNVALTMSRLPRAMQNKALRPALREGGNVVKAAAVGNVQRAANAGYSTGRLARSIVVRQLKMKNHSLRVAVAIARGKKYPTGARVGLVGSVLEFGRIKGHGGNRNTQAPRPWLRPAAASSASKVYNVILDYGRRNLAAAVAEASK